MQPRRQRQQREKEHYIDGALNTAQRLASSRKFRANHIAITEFIQQDPCLKLMYVPNTASVILAHPTNSMIFDLLFNVALHGRHHCGVESAKTCRDGRPITCDFPA